MLKISLSFFILLSGLFTTAAIAQSTKLAFNYNNYNSNLPSNTIYSIKCDKAGNLWLGTDKGLVKYDGTNFKIFNGFPDNDIVNLFYEEDTNSIWCLTYNSKIIKVNCTTDKFTVITPPQEVLGAFMYAFKQNGALKFLTSNQLFTYQNHSFSTENLPVFIFRDYLLKSDTKIPKLNTQLFTEVKWDSIQTKYFVNGADMWIINKMRIGSYNTVIFNKEIFAQNKGKIFRLLDLKPLIDDPNAFIIDIAIKNDDLIIAINGKKGGIYYIDNFFINPKSTKLKLISKNSTNATVCIDKTGNIWYALDNGLHIINQQQFNAQLTVIHHPEFLQKDTKLKAKNDDVIFLNNFNGDSYLTINKNKIDKHSKNSSSKFSSSKNTFVGTFKNYIDGKIKDISHNDSLFFYNESILQVSNGNKYKLPNSYTDYNKYLMTRKGDYYKNLVLTFASNDSLYVLDNSLKKLIYKNSAKKFGKINDIYFLNNDYILLCTNNGVFSTNISFQKIKLISTKKYKKAIIDHNITYFINDNEVAYQDRLNGKSIVSIFNNKYLLSGFSIIDFDISHNKIHLLTDIGYIELNKAVINQKPSPILFNLVSLDLKDTIFYKIDSSITIKELNSKQIKFTTHFLNAENKYYQKSYSFVKTDVKDNWINFTGNEFLQTNLSPGNYLLKIKAKLVETGEEKIISYQIRIEPKFWQTNWFLVLGIFIAICIVSLITWLLFNQNQLKGLHKIELERKIAEIENKAFLNQLNPHFLYNTLNTLQDYIIQKDTHNGIMYLQRITSLHRNILEFNQKNYITVAEEQTFLDKYLFLQQKRYSDKFNFEVKATQDALKLQLPSMLIQPLVENTIEHGFNGKEKDKFITVSFEKKLGLLSIKITDNGNGNINNIFPLKEGHALTMIMERLDFINQKNKTKRNKINIEANSPKGISINIIIDL
ncbi:MAG: histidine kinase [Sphingobacteriaceae bacterium]|nr:histidine kinase [Sphingobacteriaceae bacterium]